MTNNQTLWLYLGIVILTCMSCALVTSMRAYRSTKNLIVKDILGERRYVVSRRWIIIIAFVPLILLAGFRYYTGADYQQYVWSFERTANSNSLIRSYLITEEPLYQLSKYIVFKIFGNDPTNWFIVMAALTIINLIIAVNIIDKESKYTWFAYLFGMYTYLHMFNYVRQIYAASLVFIGVGELLKKKRVSFIIAVILATMMHRSSIIFIILLFVDHYNNSLNKLSYKIIMIVSPLFMTIIGRILRIIPFLSRYSAYFQGSFKMGIGWLIDIMPIILILLLIEYVYKPRKEILSLTYFAWLVIPLRAISYYAYALGRLYLNISLFAFVAFASVVAGSEKKRRGYEIIVIIVYLAYFIFEFYVGNNSEVFPYKSIWNH